MVELASPWWPDHVPSAALEGSARSYAWPVRRACRPGATAGRRGAGPDHEDRPGRGFCWPPPRVRCPWWTRVARLARIGAAREPRHRSERWQARPRNVRARRSRRPSRSRRSGRRSSRRSSRSAGLAGSPARAGPSRRHGDAGPGPVTVAARIALGLIGAAIVIWVLDAAVRTFLLPRVASVRLSRAIAGTVAEALPGHRLVAHALPRAGPAPRACTPRCSCSATRRAWLCLSLVAFAFLFVAAGAPSLARGFELSGSSLFTLGTTPAAGAAEMGLSYLEAAIGLTLLGAAHRVHPDDLRRVPAPRDVGLAAVGPRGGALHALGHPRDRPAASTTTSASTTCGGVGVVVHRAARDPHDPHDPQLLPDPRCPGQTWVGSATSVLDAAALYNSCGRPPAVGDGGAVHPVGLARAAGARGLLPGRVPAQTPTAPSRSRSRARSSSSRSTTSRAAASR